MSQPALTGAIRLFQTENAVFIVSVLSAFNHTYCKSRTIKETMGIYFISHWII